MQQNAVWLFDGVCVLCLWGVRYTLRHEKAPSIRFVAFQSDEGRALAHEHGIVYDDPESFLFIENGIALDKSDAVIALSAHLNGLAQIVRAFGWVPRGLRDWAYTCVARNRYRLFGRSERCMIPTQDQRHRFVL